MAPNRFFKGRHRGMHMLLTDVNVFFNSLQIGMAEHVLQRDQVLGREIEAGREGVAEIVSANSNDPSAEPEAFGCWPLKGA